MTVAAYTYAEFLVAIVGIIGGLLSALFVGAGASLLGAEDEDNRLLRGLGAIAIGVLGLAGACWLMQEAL